MRARQQAIADYVIRERHPEVPKIHTRTGRVRRPGHQPHRRGSAQLSPTLSPTIHCPQERRRLPSRTHHPYSGERRGLASAQMGPPKSPIRVTDCVPFVQWVSIMDRRKRRLTGGRTEELRALKCEHVHREETLAGATVMPPYMEVWRSVRSGGDTKTRRSRRTLALPALCLDALRKQRRVRPRIGSRSAPIGTRPVWCSRFWWEPGWSGECPA